MLVAHLHIARGDVVDDRVAPDMLHRAARTDIDAPAADDDGKLGFVVDLLGDAARQLDRRARRDDAFGRLGEDDRPGLVTLAGGPEDRARQLARVRVVVPADTEQIAARPRQRRIQRDRRQRQPRSRRLRQGLTGGEMFDQRQSAGLASVVAQ